MKEELRLRKMEKNKQKYVKTNNVTYTLEETCPHCGTYTHNGETCNNCLKKYDEYEPKVDNKIY